MDRAGSGHAHGDCGARSRGRRGRAGEGPCRPPLAPSGTPCLLQQRGGGTDGGGGGGDGEGVQGSPWLHRCLQTPDTSRADIRIE